VLTPQPKIVNLKSINIWYLILKSNLEISQRYAKALYELSLESKSLISIEKDILNFENLITKNSNLDEFIKSHVISREKKAKVIEKILKKLKSHSLIVKFMGTVALNGRINFIRNIIDQFLNKLSRERGEIKAEITTALPISNELNNTLIKEVKKLTKSEKIELKTNIDKSLIGGLVLQVGSTMIDSSIKTKLNSLKMTMKGV